MSTATVKNRSFAGVKARIAAVLRMGSEKPEDKEDDKPEEAAAETTEDTPTPSDDDSPTETIGAEQSDAPDLLDSVLNLLGEFGVTLPADTSDENLISYLRVALTALNSQEPVEEEDQDEELAKPDAMPQPVTPSIATMSVQQRKQLERAEVAEKALAESHKSSVVKRLSTLLETGRCTPAEHDAQLRTLGTVRMSMKDDGSFKSTRVDSFLEDREPVPQGTFWTKEQRTKSIEKLSVVEPPDAITSGGGRSHSEFADAVRALGGNPDA